MSAIRNAIRGLTTFACAALLVSLPATAKEFSYSARQNDRLAKKLNLPLYFMLPATARSPLAADINTTDLLIDFKHPEAKPDQNVGLRLVLTKRSGMAGRLAKSGLIQTGDILLTFRTEWAGAGPYPNIQLGVSHTGVAYVKDGIVHNIDNPLSEEYLGAGMRADLTSEHYRTLDYMHVIRPRYLTDQQKGNLLAWATRLNSKAKSIYPSKLSFNQDYNAPKFQHGKTPTFVQQLARMALDQDSGSNVGMFCSEFAWSLLSLRNCDPVKTAEQFKDQSMPACVNQPMKPMSATGDYIFSKSKNSYSGLADGPLLVIDGLKLPTEERKKMLDSVFVENEAGLKKMSVGHRTVATEMKPKFEPLKHYYQGATGGMFQSLKTRIATKVFTRDIPENYSPTSFLINTLLPTDNVNRTMDYVATIVIE